MLGPGILDGAHLRLCEGLGQIDAANFSAAGRRERPHLDVENILHWRYLLARASVLSMLEGHPQDVQHPHTATGRRSKHHIVINKVVGAARGTPTLHPVEACLLMSLRPRAHETRVIVGPSSSTIRKER